MARKQIPHQKKFVTLKDKFLILMSLAIGIVCIVPIATPLTKEPLNILLIEAIPLPIALLFLFIPFGIYFGIQQRQEHLYYTIKKERLERRKKEKSKLLFRCSYIAHEKGTAWKITNANKFDWTKANLLIERSFEGEKETEKIHLGDIAAGRHLITEANMVDIENARWRILIISREGQKIDFPDRCRAPTFPLGEIAHHLMERE